MPKVSVVETKGTAPGHCWYDTRSIWGETKHWYNQDVWTFLIDRLTLTCTAWREILTVGGYLPMGDWKAVDRILLPSVQAERGFVIEEEFDPRGRDASQAIPYRVEWNRNERIVHVQLAAESNVPKLYVSPHEGLILGATSSTRSELTDILFVGMEGLPSA